MPGPFIFQKDPGNAPPKSGTGGQTSAARLLYYRKQSHGSSPRYGLQRILLRKRPTFSIVTPVTGTQAARAA